MQLKILWSLQEKDLSLGDLEKRITEAPSASGLEESETAVTQLIREIEEEEEKLRETKKNLKNLELATQKVADDRKELNANLYSGKVGNVKELEQMQRKGELLAEEQKKNEDRIIALMEATEESESRLTELKQALNDKETELSQRTKTLSDQLAKLEAEQAVYQAERIQLAEKAEPKYLHKYEQLAAKFNGRPLAQVTDDICGGCRVFISSAIRGHLYNPGAMVYCENCGRLLVKFDDAD